MEICTGKIHMEILHLKQLMRQVDGIPKVMDSLRTGKSDLELMEAGY